MVLRPDVCSHTACLARTTLPRHVGEPETSASRQPHLYQLGASYTRGPLRCNRPFCREFSEKNATVGHKRDRSAFPAKKTGQRGPKRGWHPTLVYAGESRSLLGSTTPPLRFRPPSLLRTLGFGLAHSGRPTILIRKAMLSTKRESDATRYLSPCCLPASRFCGRLLS